MIEPIEIKCPTCGSEPNEKCRDDGIGVLQYTFHNSRMALEGYKNHIRLSTEKHNALVIEAAHQDVKIRSLEDQLSKMKEHLEEFIRIDLIGYQKEKLRDIIAIPRDLTYRYEKACAVLDTSNDVDLRGSPVAAAVIAMASLTKDFVERIAALNQDMLTMADLHTIAYKEKDEYIAALESQLATLGRKISDEEWARVSGYEANDVNFASRESTDALLASRVAELLRKP